MPTATRKKIVYYAHAMCLYEHPREDLELQLIRAAFQRHRVVNPASYDSSPAKRRDTIDFCLRLIDQSDVVVYSRLLGKVTCGVGAEVNHALKCGKPVFEIRRGRIARRKKPLRYLRREATKNLYRRFRLLYG